MFIIFLLIGISVTVAGCFLGAFLWAVRSGQYDDDYTPAVRMLFENEPILAKEKPDAGKTKAVCPDFLTENVGNSRN